MKYKTFIDYHQSLNRSNRDTNIFSSDLNIDEFIRKYSTRERIHRVVDFIYKSLKILLVLFLDISQSFEKILLNSYLCDSKFFSVLLRNLFVSFNDPSSIVRNISSGVPLGSILSTVLNFIYTADIPTIPKIVIATLANDTGILQLNLIIKSLLSKTYLNTQIK